MRKDIDLWKTIDYWMKIYGIGRQLLADLTLYPPSFISKGLAAEPGGHCPSLPLDFLQKCVKVFCYTKGRGKPAETLSANLTREECEELLQPPAAMPTEPVNRGERLDFD